MCTYIRVCYDIMARWPTWSAKNAKKLHRAKISRYTVKKLYIPEMKQEQVEYSNPVKYTADELYAVVCLGETWAP